MDPFIGEIRIFSGNFPPRDWAFCEGQVLSISQNAALYSVIGTRYGGDGHTNFALPDLRGRSPINQGTGQGLTNRQLGTSGGTEHVSLNINEIPFHSHLAQNVQANGNKTSPDGAVWAKSTGRPAISTYNTEQPSQAMHFEAAGHTGSSAPHNNRQPYVGMRFIIALQGVFPARP